MNIVKLKNAKVSWFMLFFLLANVLLTACEGEGGSTPSQPSVETGTGEAPGIYQAPTSQQDAGAPTPTVEPMPVPEPGNLADFIEGGVAMAVMLPYNGHEPNGTCIEEYWKHMQLRHLPGGQADIYPASKVMEFLQAVKDGTAELFKIGVRAGDGLVGAFRWQGANWLLFLGKDLKPTSYIPQNGIGKAMAESRQVLNAPIGGKYHNSFRLSAGCFKENAPVEVRIMVEAEMEVMVEYAVVPEGMVHDPLATRIAPLPDASYPRVALSPEIVTSGQLPVPIYGTPQFHQLDSTMWNPEIQSYVWIPNYGYHGLTAEDIMMIAAFTGGTIIVVGTVYVAVQTAPIWVPVVVIGGSSAAPVLALP